LSQYFLAYRSNFLWNAHSFLRWFCASAISTTEGVKFRNTPQLAAAIRILKILPVC